MLLIGFFWGKIGFKLRSLFIFLLILQVIIIDGDYEFTDMYLLWYATGFMILWLNLAKKNEI